MTELPNITHEIVREPNQADTVIVSAHDKVDVCQWNPALRPLNESLPELTIFKERRFFPDAPSPFSLSCFSQSFSSKNI
jgi:hypothetical protein